MAGRPTDYKQEYCQLAIDLMSEGASITEVAAKCGVTKSTLYLWVKVYPEFGKIIMNHPNKIRQRKLGIKWENAKQYQLEKYHKDPLTKVRVCITSSIRSRIKSTKKGTFRHLDYDCEQLISHIESQFKKGMNWENYGKDWQIDHVIPVSWFKNIQIGSEEFKHCWALHNLKPEWSKYNRLKNNKYSENPQLKLLVA